MKKFFLILTAFLMAGGEVFAAVDRYKTDVDDDHTINHITYELPFYYAKDRTNLVGTYTLATNIGGKSSGTLSFDFKETENKFSTELRNAILRVSKDIREQDNSRISISFTLASGETFTFDGSYFSDWNKNEWNQILHVAYDRETNVYRSYIMFPLEFLDSSTRNLPSKSGKRYDYVLKALSKHNISKINISCESRSANVKIDIPIHRPTAETMNDMINHKIKATKSKKSGKSRVENGHMVKKGRH